MCAMAEKVVPRSIPTALRLLMAEKVGRRGLRSARGLSAVFVPQNGKNFARSAMDNCRKQSRSAETLCDHFLGANQLAAPDESAFHPHDDRTVFFREVGRFEVDDA